MIGRTLGHYRIVQPGENNPNPSTVQLSPRLRRQVR